MIALPQKLPHVIWKNDRLVPLSEGWLAESIEHSAAAAGHPRWHLAPEIARAIAVYLETTGWRRRSRSIICSRWCGARSRESASTKSRRRAGSCRRGFPFHWPSWRCGGRPRSEFYPLLKERLGDALEVQVAGVRLEGLRDCTKILDSAGRWRRTCFRINDEIIDFCRTYMARFVPRTVDLVIQ